MEWKNNSVIMIDQTKLPNSLEYVTYTDYNDVAAAIRNLVIRGAPAIGVAGAFGLALAALQSSSETTDDFLSDLVKAKKILLETRPTAIPGVGPSRPHNTWCGTEQPGHVRIG